MDFNRLFKQLLPHLAVIAAFVAIIALYFSPLVFKGQNLKQSDASQWAGMAQEISEFRKANDNQEPLWTNSQFSGMPAYTISVIYSGEMLHYVENVFRMGLPYPASILLTALLCYYILMLSLGHRPHLAALGAIAFTFFTFNFVSIEAGHNSKVRAMAMAPLLLSGLVLLFRDKRLLGFALTALGMGLQIGAGHYQITYYLALFCVFLGVGQLIHSFRTKLFGKFVAQIGLALLAVGVGVGANAARLLQLQEYAQYSMRGKPELTPKTSDTNQSPGGGLARDYVFSWSNGLAEPFTLIIPGFYGGSSSEKVQKDSEVARQLRTFNQEPSTFQPLPYYWGDQPFTSGPVYAGAIVIFLAVLGLFVLGADVWGWMLAAILFSIVLTWGRNLPSVNYFLYDHFPAYKQFRSVTMAIVIAQWALPWLAVTALHRFLSPGLRVSTSSEDAVPLTQPAVENQKRFAALRNAAIAVGGLLLLFVFAPGLAGDFTTPNDEQLPKDFKDALYNSILADRESMLRSDAVRSLLFVLVAAGLLFATFRGWLKMALTVPIIAILVLFDLWSVNMRYLNKDSFQKNFYQQNFLPTAADQRMMQQPYHTYRVLNLQGPFSESRTSYYHQSIGGYSPVKLRRYQDLIMGPLTAEIQAIPQLLNTPGANPQEAFKKIPILNMLNAKYIKYGDKAEEVIENPNACGNAWFVSAIKEVRSPDDEYAELSNLNQTFDPKTYALVDVNKFKITNLNLSNEGTSAKLVNYKPNRLEYLAETPKAGLMVMSENYYPEGWTATIDGKEAPLIRVDYTLRAIEVPAGKHTIVCQFMPTSYTMGNTLSMISSLLIYGMLAVVAVVSFRKKKHLATTPAIDA